MRLLGYLSGATFIISLVMYGMWFFNEDAFSGIAMIAAVILPIIGITAALLTKTKSLKFIGLVGNGVVFFWAVVIPFIASLFWNTP